MIFHSIRWRLQAWYGLILVAVLAGFGLTAYHVARDNQLRRIDQDLDLRIKTLFRPQSPGWLPERFLDQPPDGPRDLSLEPRSGQRRNELPGEPRNDRGFGFPDFLFTVRDAVQRGGTLDPSQTNTFYYVLWQEDGSIVARSPGAPAGVPAPKHVGTAGSQAFRQRDAFKKGSLVNVGPDVPSEARTRGQMREMFRFLPRGQCVLVGRSLAPDLAAMRRLTLWLGAAGAAVLVLGLAGGWWVATRAIQPIEAISATAVKIAGGDLSQRINAADTDSELGRLAGVLNSTFARLEAAFTQQARFTSDASHELRTPVSVILSQTHTALSRQRPGPEYREALEACQRAARRMNTLT